MPPITKLLLALNVGIFALQAFSGTYLIEHFALWPLGESHFSPLNTDVGFQPWQLITSAFLHANLTHIGFNMFALFMFGQEVEQKVSSKNFAILYFISVLTAAIVQLIVVSTGGETYPTIGASGGVFGILLAFGYFFPRRQLLLLFPPIPIRAWLFVILYGAVELISGITNTAAGIAHFAHLGGMLGAILFLVYRKSRISSGSR